MNRRILFLSSTRFPWFESQDAEDHVREAPYSINAIGYNLAKRGWSVAWAGWKSGRRLRALAENAARDIPVYSWAEIAERFEAVFQSL